MFLIDKIEPFYFFMALFVGIFLTYIYTPPPEIIFVFPTPDNEDTIYNDDSNNCYKYKSINVKCPANKKLINEIPVNIE